MDPASLLFIVSQVLLALVIPLAALGLTWGYHQRAMLWYAGGVFYSLYVILVALRPWGFAVAYGVPSLILFPYLAILIDVLRQELGRKSRLSLYLPLALFCAGAHVILILQGQSLNAGPAQVFLATCIIIGNSLICFFGIQCQRVHASRSMYMVAAAGFLSAGSNVLRLYEVTLGSGSFSLLEFNWLSATMIISHMLAIIFLNSGYAGYIIEQTARAKAEAQMAQRMAEERSDELAKTIRERNEMILLNSRFVTLSGISFFTAAIIHELTQPLQAMKLAMSTLVEDTKEAAIAPQVHFLAKQAEDCDEIIRSLRRIMVRGSVDVQSVDLEESIRSLMPILRTQTEKKGIQFEGHLPQTPVFVECNSVLFQRILFNLATNAMEALSLKEMGERFLTISLRADAGQAQVRVSDNSGRAADMTQFNLSRFIESSKPDGMGIGLALSGKLAQQWGGAFTALSEPKMDQVWTVFALDLPLSHPPNGQ